MLRFAPMKMSRASRLALAAAIAIASIASAQPAPTPPSSHQTSALINQQLDKRFQFAVDSAPLPQVLEQIEKSTGVPVRVTDDVYDLLPWGMQTPITAKVENSSLRDALSAMGKKLGLRMELRDEWLELSPNPALKRIGRRATLQELQTLDVLSSVPLNLASDAPVPLADLAKAIDAALLKNSKTVTDPKSAPSNIVVELRRIDDVDISKMTVIVPRAATLSDALHAISTQTKMTWYPWGDSLLILPKKAVIGKQLDRHLALRYDGVDIAQVLIDLANRTDVDFSIEPGAIQRVPPEFRIIKLTADASVRQSLESLQGYTGLGYVVTDDGVYIWNQNSSPTGGSGSRGKVVATVTVGDNASVLIYEDDLSQNARDALKAKRDAAIGALQGALTGIVGPSTQPASN